VAALVRTIAPYSLYTPHTGATTYDLSVPPIPTACITVEDAEMLGRMYARGQQIRLILNMTARMAAPVTSYNILAEVVGRESPREVVVIGGHSDSWDVGTGAIDDGGGIFTSWEALKIIHDQIVAGRLQRPRRTIRVVFWVDEELEQQGAKTYLNNQLNELENHVLAAESDSGNFAPTGFGFSGVPAAKAIMQQIGSVLLSRIGVGNITDGGADADNGYLVRAGVPGASLKSTGDYFWFHHSHADTVTHVNKQGFIDSVAAFAVMSYVIADMEQRLPNKEVING